LGWGNTATMRVKYFDFGTNGGYNNVTPTRNLVIEFETGDPRRTGTIWLNKDLVDYRPGKKLNGQHFDSSWGKNTGYSFKKTMYPLWYGKDNLDCPYNYPVIRYANVLLMYAECLYFTGQDDPLKYINFVRARVGLPAATLSMPQALVHERRVELAFECQRFRDLIRWSKNGILNQLGKTIQDYIPTFETGKHEYLPLPQYEIDLSQGVLIQNPAYNQ
jgi:hypothetical protein